MIVPPSPGVLCALGDATTSVRDGVGAHGAPPVRRPDRRRASRRSCASLAARGRGTARANRASPRTRRSATRSTSVTTARASRSRSTVPPTGCDGDALSDAGRRTSTREHERLFSFLLGADHELVNARATVTGPRPSVAATTSAGGRRRPAGGAADTHPVLRRRRWVPTPRSTTARRCAPATSSPVPRSSSRWTRRRSSCRRTPRPCTRAEACSSHLRQEPEMATHRRDRDRHRREDRGRPGHPRPDRERAAQRPLRDGRGALPHRALPRHPRAARRVPADRRSEREDGGRASSDCRSPTSSTGSTTTSRRATSC